jgi:hypothetical protein
LACDNETVSAGHNAKLKEATIRTMFLEETNSESLKAPTKAIGVAKNINKVIARGGKKNNGALSKLSAQTHGSAAPTKPNPMECELDPAWPNISNQLEEVGNTPEPVTETLVGTQGRFSATSPSAHQIAPEATSPEFGAT